MTNLQRLIAWLFGAVIGIVLVFSLTLIPWNKDIIDYVQTLLLFLPQFIIFTFLFIVLVLVIRNLLDNENIPWYLFLFCVVIYLSFCSIWYFSH